MSSSILLSSRLCTIPMYLLREGITRASCNYWLEQQGVEVLQTEESRVWWLRKNFWNILLKMVQNYDHGKFPKSVILFYIVLHSPLWWTVEWHGWWRAKPWGSCLCFQSMMLMIGFSPRRPKKIAAFQLSSSSWLFSPGPLRSLKLGKVAIKFT